MRTFGLIGFPLEHSFSPAYFQQKFTAEKIVDAEYRSFPLERITDFPRLILSQNNWAGFNVTIPFKTAILPYLDELDEAAAEIGAANVIKIVRNTQGIRLIGYNSDAMGFERSLKEFLPQLPKRALILGTGGAAKAVKFVLEKNNVKAQFVSRKRQDELLNYNDSSKDIINSNPLIINATPVGMYPQINEAPDIPYEYLTTRNALFDLVYNPKKTLFLQKGETKDAKICNGLPMLHYQAEASWQIWTS